MATRLFDRAVLLAKNETTFRTDAAPSASVDALLIGNPEFNPDIAQLERNNVKDDLSPLASAPGRKIARLSFAHEVRNNGVADGTTPPVIAALLKACGFAQTQRTGTAGTISAATAGGSNVGTVAFAKTTAYTGYVPRTVTLTCTLAGASGVAEVTVASAAVGEVAVYSQTGVVVTDAVAITLPGGAQVTPTVSADLDVGDVWTFTLTPAGYEYTPISTAFDSVTLHLYRDGVLHKMTGCRGTVSVQCQGGQYGLFNFTFTGDYVAPVDAATPSATYETQKPVQCELAQLKLGSYENFAAQQVTFDLANDVQIREDLNASNAYAGAIIVGRKPVVTINPEAVLEADHPVWADLAAGTEKVCGFKIGTTKGNVVAFDFPNVQQTNVQYGNRNSLLTYDITLNCARTSGNDEVKISFR